MNTWIKTCANRKCNSNFKCDIDLSIDMDDSIEYINKKAIEAGWVKGRVRIDIENDFSVCCSLECLESDRQEEIFYRPGNYRMYIYLNGLNIDNLTEALKNVDSIKDEFHKRHAKFCIEWLIANPSENEREIKRAKDLKELRSKF